MSNKTIKFISTLKHEHKFMFSLIVAQLFCIALIYLWPKQEFSTEVKQYVVQNEDIFVEDVIITQQRTAPAAPPKPPIPVPVPNDEVIEDIIEFPEPDEIFTDNPLQIEEDGVGRVGDTGELVGSPDQPPGIVRIVEPTIPEAAKRAGIKAEVIVSFLVDETGKVEEIVFSEIRLYDGNQYEVVNDIGYGILGVIMEAALKWRFRPAKHEGRPVKTYVKNSFNIGF